MDDDELDIDTEATFEQELDDFNEFAEDGDFQAEGGPPVEQPIDPDMTGDEDPDPDEDVLDDAEVIAEEGRDVVMPRTIIAAPAADATSKNPDRRIFAQFLTKYELARVISQRTTQIQNGSPAFVKSDSIDPAIIAQEEIDAGKCPLVIFRLRFHSTATEGEVVEEWSVNELVRGFR